MGSAEFFFLLLLTLPLALVPLLFKGTALELNFGGGAVYPLIFYKMLAFIIPAYLIVQYWGVDAFPLTFLVATDDITFRAGLWIIYSLYAFFIFLAVSLRVLPASATTRIKDAGSIDASESTFASSIFLSGAALFLVAAGFLGHKHAFLYSLWSGESLLRVRLDNAYFSSLPSQISQMFILCSWLLAVYAGRSSVNHGWLWGGVYFVGAIFFASIRGDKAPLIDVSFLFFVGRLTVCPLRVSAAKLFLFGGGVSVLLLSSMFFVVRVQAPEMTVDQYLLYLADRAGVGQMAGTYESFAVGGLEGDFFWHMVPFASFFVDYPIYDKELMVFVENVGHTDMGVKNSLFISEAFGIGGYSLVILSPIIVAVSYALAIMVFYRWFYMLYGRGNAAAYSFPVALLMMNITGDFSSFPLLKGCIQHMILIALFFPGFFLVDLIFRPLIRRSGVAT